MSLRGSPASGVWAGLGAAALFGLGTPVAKLLLGGVGPWLWAGLLYTASGVALFAWRAVRRSVRVRLQRSEAPFLVAAVTFGGVLGPVLLMFGLTAMPASGASLLLNAEGVFTALIAWLVFREATDRRIVLGFVLIAAGAVVLSWSGSVQFSDWWPAAAVLGACLCWGIDNNATRQIALADATWLAAVKGAIAGPVNLGLAFAMGARLPSVESLLGAGVVGVFSYGVSLVLFIVALDRVGTARAGAYFALGPFFGAALAVALGEPVTWTFGVAGLLMAAGVTLHLRERHEHRHTHQAVVHEHWHTHEDGHHDHAHDPALPQGTSHRHVHRHGAVTHSHPHFPDSHHRHAHG